MKYLVYLAGPITGCTYEGANDWREYAQRAFAPNIAGLSPMRGKEYLKNQGAMPHTYEHILSTQQAIMGRDMFDVRRCDMLLVNMLGAKVVSVGTVLEIGAAYALNKPVVLVMEKEGNPHDHPMVRQACAWRVEALDEGILVVNATLGVQE